MRTRSRKLPPTGLRMLMAGTAVAFALPGGALADDLSDLRAQLEALAQQVERLEAAQASEELRVRRVEERIANTQVATPIIAPLRNPAAIGSKRRDVPSDDEFQSSPGTAFVLGNTEIEIGGFAKLDLIFDTEESTGDLFVPQGISVLNDTDNEAFRAHANESRLFFKTNTPTTIGDIRFHIEADFFASTISSNEIVTNSFPFRLRHAYGALQRGKHEVLAGQFWSALVPIETYPSTVDFGGPAGNSFLRQAQLRYTYDASESLRFVISLENSETTLRDDALEFGGGLGGASTGFGVDAGLDVIPDFVLTARHTSENSLVKGAVLLRQLNAPFSSDSELGYGLQVSGKYDFTDRFTLSGAALYGEGVGRYVFVGINQGAFLGTGDNGQEEGTIDAIETVSGFARASYGLTDTVTLVGTYGYYDLLETFTEADTDDIQTAHLTMFWTPLPDLTVGSEVILGRRELVSGADDDFLRLQASVKWSF